MKMIIALLALLTPVAMIRAESLPIYSSDFERGTTGWSGRPGFGKSNPKIDTGVEGAKEEGKFYAWVETDGKLGSGFSLKPNIPCEPDKEYLLSFWIKSERSIPLTYQLTTTGGRGEASGAWHGIAKSDNEWVRVEYAFVPLKSTIGLDIGVSNKEYTPTKIYIYDVKITPN